MRIARRGKTERLWVKFVYGCDGYNYITSSRDGCIPPLSHGIAVPCANSYELLYNLIAIDADRAAKG